MNLPTPTLVKLTTLSLLGALVVSCASSPSAPVVATTSIVRPPAPPLRALPAPVARTSKAIEFEPSAGLWADLKSAPGTIGGDLVDVFTSLDVWLVLAGGFVGGELFDKVGLEEPTSQFFSDHSLLSDGLSRTFDELGSGYLLFAGAGVWYLWSDVEDDDKGLDGSKRLLRSLSTTGLSTLVFKEIFADQRPNGAKGGYPSGHTSMSVTTAASLWYSYGPKVGVPATILASLVALQRLDSRAHEMDDVIGGAVLGWVVARSLNGDEPLELFGARVLPGTSPSGDPGISLLWSY